MASVWQQCYGDSADPEISLAVHSAAVALDADQRDDDDGLSCTCFPFERTGHKRCQGSSSESRYAQLGFRVAMAAQCPDPLSEPLGSSP